MLIVSRRVLHVLRTSAAIVDSGSDGSTKVCRTIFERLADFIHLG